MRPYLLQAFMEVPWAILPSKLIVIQEIVIRHVNGEKLDPEEVQQRIHGARRPDDRRVRNANDNRGETRTVAVLPLFGTIFPRANMMTDMSGATSAEIFGAQFQQLVDDPNVSAIVLDVDSPGGRADGIQELSDRIYNARGRKPIVAVADHMMASAAYWIGTAADEVVASPSSEMGSIGAFAAHEDVSKAMEQDGIKMTLISEGKFKVEGNPFEPLGEEARGAIQARVRNVYDAFVESVARNRGVKESSVRNGFGEGRVVGAKQAVAEGMADRVGTLEQEITRLLDLKQPIGAGSQVSIPGGAESSEEPVPAINHEAQRLREEITQFLANPAVAGREE
jgi:signal peptide peptidase SppA